MHLKAFSPLLLSSAYHPVSAIMGTEQGGFVMRIHAFEVRADEKPYFEILKDSGMDIVIHDGPCLLDDILSLETGCGVSVLGMHRYEEAEMEAFEKHGIHCLSTRTIGYDHIDLNAARKHGIHVSNASYAPNGVADYTVMMMLLCLRCYKQALWRMQVNDYSLQGLIGKELRDMTVGVIGCGRIGTQVIQNLSGFGCRILAFDKHRNETVLKYASYVESLDDIYRQCDIITLHTTLNDSSYHMINKDSLSRMKKGVILINCARGPLMDIQALIHGIETEQIGALGLDTVEDEQTFVHQNRMTDIFSDRDIAYLRQFKNVVYTQHMAFYTEEAVQSMVESSVSSLVLMAEGKSCRTQLC